MIRVLVCGGRTFSDRDFAFDELDRIHEHLVIKHLIHGAARGADTIASEWAQARNVPEAEFPADWDKHRRAAGAIRNRQMILVGKPHLVVAFPGGPGTEDMVRVARRHRVPIIRY